MAIDKKDFLATIAENVKGIGEIAKHRTAAYFGNRKSRKRIKKAVAKEFEKAGMSQSPQNMDLYKHEVKKRKKAMGL